MRSRSNSGVRLDGFARLVHETILCHQVSSKDLWSFAQTASILFYFILFCVLYFISFCFVLFWYYVLFYCYEE